MNLKLIACAIFVVLLFSACTPRKYVSPEEFKALNICQSDAECTIGQVDMGPDLPSPSPECFAKKAIEASNPNHLFESKNTGVLQYLSCACNLTTNNCETISKIKEK